MHLQHSALLLTQNGGPHIDQDQFARQKPFDPDAGVVRLLFSKPGIGPESVAPQIQRKISAAGTWNCASSCLFHARDLRVRWGLKDQGLRILAEQARPTLHGENPAAVTVTGMGQGARHLRRPQQTCRAATLADFSYSARGMTRAFAVGPGAGRAVAAANVACIPAAMACGADVVMSADAKDRAKPEPSTDASCIRPRFRTRLPAAS